MSAICNCWVFLMYIIVLCFAGFAYPLWMLSSLCLTQLGVWLHDWADLLTAYCRGKLCLLNFYSYVLRLNKFPFISSLLRDVLRIGIVTCVHKVHILTLVFWNKLYLVIMLLLLIFYSFFIIVLWNWSVNFLPWISGFGIKYYEFRSVVTA